MTTIAQLRFISVVVRQSPNMDYHARVPGQPLRCSNTQGFDNAAKAIGAKYYGSATVYRVGGPNPSHVKGGIIPQIPLDTDEDKAFAAQLNETGITHVIVP